MSLSIYNSDRVILPFYLPDFNGNASRLAYPQNVSINDSSKET